MLVQPQYSHLEASEHRPEILSVFQWSSRDSSWFCTYWDEPCGSAPCSPCGYPNIWVTFKEHADNSMWLLRSVQLLSYPSCDSCKSTFNSGEYVVAKPILTAKTDSPYFDYVSRVTDLYHSSSTRPLWIS